MKILRRLKGALGITLISSVAFTALMWVVYGTSALIHGVGYWTLEIARDFTIAMAVVGAALGFCIAIGLALMAGRAREVSAGAAFLGGLIVAVPALSLIQLLGDPPPAAWLLLNSTAWGTVAAIGGAGLVAIANRAPGRDSERRTVPADPQQASVAKELLS